MTDQEKPGFKVVDKRRAAPENATPDTERTQPTDESATSASPDADRAATTQASPPAGTATDNSAESTAPPNSEAEGSEAPGEDQPFVPDPGMLLAMAALQMDPPTLMTALLGIFDKYAWQAMGLVANPLTGEVSKDLPQAQMAIDCVQFLLGKVESRLSDTDRRDAQRRLSDLRMNYLAKLRES